MSYDKLKGGFKSANGYRIAQQSNCFPAGLNDGSVKEVNVQGENYHELKTNVVICFENRLARGQNNIDKSSILEWIGC